MRRIPRRAVRLGLVALAFGAALPSVATAQRGQATPRLRADGEPERPSKTIKTRRGFGLFGLADVAYAAIKTSNPNYYWGTCNDSGSITCGNGFSYSFLGPSDPAYFSTIDWAWGGPPSIRDTILKRVPGAGLNRAIGGGFVAFYNAMAGATDVLMASDGQLGSYTAGAQSTLDRTCRDHRQGGFGSGNPLLPTSDCPETWGPLGWQGRKPVPASDYLAALRADPANAGHVFDFWKYPAGEPDGKIDRQFGSYQTYGFFRDYSRDDICGTAQTRTYGKVLAGVPLGQICGASTLSVEPTKPGYPLGLEVRFDAFSYGIPALQDVVFYQATVVNNSKTVYGVGIDYDSLYIGPMPASYSATQRNLVFYRPELGGMIHTPVCSHQLAASPCNGAKNVADLTIADVTSTSLGGNSYGEYGLGAAAFLVLKSPIGDLRNKLFTRAGSPFSTVAGIPANVKDDTITFNTGHLCGFRSCNRTTYTLDPTTNSDAIQRVVGLISSTERNVLGLRTPATMGGSPAGQALWHTFRSVDWPLTPPVGTGPTDFPQVGGFNRYTPPGWDWNNDGKNDTLYYDTCSSRTGGGTLATSCSGLFSDTMPHTGDASRRWLNGYSNVGGVMTVGPLHFKAGDTISFTFAATSACCGAGFGDSLAIITKVNAAIDHYLNFYLGPEPLPRDTIAGVTVVGGNQPESRVTLVFTPTAENSRDAFLLNLASKYATAGPGTADQRLAKLNKRLVDSLIAYAVPFGYDTAGVTGIGNFSNLYIFKSCDQGNTFTNNANCTPSPATGGKFQAVGWLPYATISRDANTGDISNVFTDENVAGGGTYTYVVVAESRGANFQLVTGDAIDSATTTSGKQYFCTANCKMETIAFAPSLFNPLSTSGTNAVTVYVPASLQAGGSNPLVSVTATSGPVPASRIIVTPASNTPRAGTYTLSFYDNVTVTVRDSLNPEGTALLGTRTTVVAYKGTTPTTLVSTAKGGLGLSGGTITSSTTTGATGTPKIRTTTWSFGSVTGVLTYGTSEPIMVTNNFAEDATPESFIGSTAFPGFALGFEETSVLGRNNAYGEQFFTDSATLAQKVGDLVEPFVQLRATGTTVGPGAQGGLYKLNWQDHPFGPNEPFHIDSASPQATKDAILASLAARAVAQTGDASAATAAAIGLGTSTSDLIQVKLPFEISNTSFGRPVTVAMKRRASNNYLFGVGGDTVTVTVPEDIWMPGDQLILLEKTSTTGPATVTFSTFTLGCDPALSARTSCNPIALLTRGSTGTTWITTKPGMAQTFLYNPAFSTAQQYQIVVAAKRTGDQLAAACVSSGGAVTDDAMCKDIKRGIKNVRAVPNPYVVFSQYGGAGTLTKPLLFTNVPPIGMLRIYSVSGQIVQQISWTQADLNGTGDLSYNLRTREGLEIAGGLYLFTITGRDANGREIGSHMGKFVVIR